MIKIIHTKEAHEAAIAELDKLMRNNPRRGTPEYDEMELLTLVIRDYEDKRFGEPVPPDPIEAIKFRMEQMGISAVDLQPCIGSRTRVYEVLNRKRPLSKNMIRALHDKLEISADILIGRK